MASSSLEALHALLESALPAEDEEEVRGPRSGDDTVDIQKFLRLKSFAVANAHVTHFIVFFR